jgi:glyoxylase I family protein
VTGGSGSPISGLSHAQLLVSDVVASAAWYSAVLGLEPLVEDLGIGYVALRHRGAKVVIVLTGDPGADPGGLPQPTGTAPGGLDHLAFAVPDGDALCAWADHLTAVGIDHPGVVLENGNPSLQLRDPDGIAIELVAPGPRSDVGPDVRRTG